MRCPSVPVQESDAIVAAHDGFRRNAQEETMFHDAYDAVQVGLTESANALISTLQPLSQYRRMSVPSDRAFCGCCYIVSSRCPFFRPHPVVGPCGFRSAEVAGNPFTRVGVDTSKPSCWCFPGDQIDFSRHGHNTGDPTIRAKPPAY